MHITICGLAASGKSTIARLLAIRHHLTYISLGFIFRAVGMLALRKNLNIATISETEMRKRVGYRWDGSQAKIAIDEADVTEVLHDSRIAETTACMLAQSENWGCLQRFCDSIVASYADIVCEGRNAGMEFLPHAFVKFALVANLEVKVARRYAEFNAKGCTFSFQEIERQIKERDEDDMQRSCAPFRIPCDATVIDTTHLTIEECVERMSVVIAQRKCLSV